MVGHYASYAHGYNGQDENGKKLAKQARKLDIHPLPPSPFLPHCQLGHHSFNLYGPPRYVVLSLKQPRFRIIDRNYQRARPLRIQASLAKMSIGTGIVMIVYA